MSNWASERLRLSVGDVLITDEYRMDYLMRDTDDAGLPGREQNEEDSD